MLWKNLLNAVARYAEAHPEDPGIQTLQTAADVCKKPLPEYLDGMDIRNVGNLRKMVPMAFPRPLRRAGELQAKVNSHGSWTVYAGGEPMDPEHHRRRYLR